MRLVLVGNYGVGNMGDDAIHAYFLRAFPEVEWTVLSAHPQKGEVPRLPFGIRSFFATPWWRTVRAIASSDGMVFGGGTLFTDVESVLACRLWWWHAAVAHFFGKPLYLAFQGIGPFRTTVGESYARRVAAWSRLISVRDDASLARVSAWELSAKIVRTFDPAISLIEAKKDGVRTNSLYIIPRANSDENFLNTSRTLGKSQKWDGIIIVTLQPDDPSEREVVQTLVNLLQDGQSVTVVSARDIQTLAEILTPAGMVLTHRFHGGLAALMVGAPFGVVYQGDGDKLAQLDAWKQEGAEKLLAQVRLGESALREALGLSLAANSIA